MSTMGTKPTRSQQQAREKAAEALVLIAEAARLDGGGRLDGPAFADLARRVASASSAIGHDEIVARALELRATAMGLPSDAAELLTLMESEIPPTAMLVLDDEDFRAQVDRMREELGEV